MPLPLNGVIQVTAEYLHFDQRLMNTLHYRVTGIGTDDSDVICQAIADQMADTASLTSMATRLLNVTPSSCNLQRIRVQIIKPTRQSYVSKAVNQAGARDASATANLDAVATKRTASAGRSQVGDFYIPGLAVGDQIGGLIDAGLFGELLTNLVFLKNSFTLSSDPTVTMKPVIFHRGNGTVTDITNFYVQPEVRVMTRRTVGRGI